MSRLASYLNTDSLKGRLRYFIVNLLLFVILAITVFLIFMTKSQLNKTYTDELNAIVKLQRQSVEKWINERELDIKFLSSKTYTNTKEIKSFLELFVLNQSEFYSISYVDKKGMTLVESTFDTKHNFHKEQFFLDALDGMDTISEARVSKDGKMPIIYFSSPVFDEYDDVVAVIIGAVRLSSIQNLVEDFRFSKTGETFIVNQEGKLLTKRKFENITILKEIEKTYLNKEFYINYAGSDVLGVTTHALFNRWTIVAQISTTEMYHVFKTFIIYISLFVVLLLIMIIPIIMLFSNKLEKPLKSLLKGSKTIENGEYGHHINSESITHSTIEIRELTHSFNSMSNKLNNVIGELKLSSTIDVLSQLFNRRELMRLSSVAYSRSKKDKSIFSILMIDIDFFKKINDNYGHRAGDIAISLVSNTIKTSISSTDIAGRYGGEEFVVFIANADLEQSAQIAQRIRRNVENLVIQSDESKFSCTCSIGLFHKDTLASNLSLEDVIELSDNALYRAKENGRNKVEIIIG
jgi:diguanylate cyclase (GGDEF)-like protein